MQYYVSNLVYDMPPISKNVACLMLLFPWFNWCLLNKSSVKENKYFQ